MIFALLGIAALALIVLFFGDFLTGAGSLLVRAKSYGTKGIILYFACWVIFTPLMVIISVAYGYMLAKNQSDYR